MESKTYYHNLTKNWFNKSDYKDAVESSDIGDIIKISFSGNALVIDLIKEDLEIESKGEYAWARKQFLDYFKKFHEVDLIQNKIKQKILTTISDLCTDFLYYDRKDGAELKMGQIEEAVKKGEITIDEMVEKFRKELESGIDISDFN